jgi:hypothetical protein
MPFEFVWDAAYEDYPVQGTNRSLIDDEERRLARGVRERMEVEHNWGPYTEKDDGSHRGGVTTVAQKGADPTGISNPKDGALYLKVVGSDLQLYVRYEGAWHQVSSLGHSGLLNLDKLVHPQYLQKIGGQMEGNLDMGGFGIRNTSGWYMQTKDGFVYGQHAKVNGYHYQFGNLDTVSLLTIPADAVYWGALKWSGNLGAGDEISYSFGTSYRLLPPMFYAEDHDIALRCPDGHWGFRLYNTALSNRDYRWNCRLVNAGWDT